MAPVLPTYKPKQILAELGYNDPMDAARQQARMILLGRMARYEAEMQRLASKWHVTLAELKTQYEEVGEEDFAADDDYLDWRWLSDAAATTQAQLDVLDAS